MRKPIIAGNWKMNKTPSEARELVSALVPLVQDAKCDVVVCTPAVDFAAVSEGIKGTNIKLGAENMHWKESGAYTGELSAAMLKESGVEYVILGHSERRQYFGETDATVNQRVLAAVKAGLTPIICVGEKKEEREAGYTNALVTYQTQIALSGLTAEEPPLGVPVHGGGHEAEAHLGLGPHVRPADQHFLRVRHLPTPPPVGILHQGGKQQAPLLRRHRQKHWVVVKIDHKAPFWIVHVHSSFYPWREPPVWCTFACHYPLRKG